MDLWKRATGVLASGLWSVSQGATRYPDGVFPLLAERGEGCWLYDTHGRRYVDWIMGWGPVLLGYRHPEVEAAIGRQLPAGPLLSLLHPIEIEVAETLREMVPCAERVAFGKNGSDVLAAAVRVARAATGREGVLVCGYHGFHDWFMASVPGCLGIPEPLRWLVRAFVYNDLEGLRRLVAEHGASVAAIVLEPVAAELPAPGFLAGVRRLCSEHGIVLVFDEVLTALRLARGGAQELYGVVPDLACLGKSMANGMPLSALVGRSELMEAVHHIGYGLTFRGETLSLAAARASLLVHRRERVAEHVAAVGEQLRAGFAGLCAAHGVAARLTGPGARLSFAFDAHGPLPPLGLRTLFVQECVRAGVLTNGNLLPSFAHDEAAVATTLQAFDGALATVRTAIQRASLEGLLHIEPQPLFVGDRS
jgi:glutamate-1-semialdehyde 2,1-aminomutase